MRLVIPNYLYLTELQVVEVSPAIKTHFFKKKNHVYFSIGSFQMQLLRQSPLNSWFLAI